MADEKRIITLASTETLREWMSQKKNQAAFSAVLPKHLDMTRGLRIALSAVSRNSLLQACTLPSVVRAVMQAASLGLEVEVNGEAYLVPFKNNRIGAYEATLITGYKGMIKLAHQSRTIEAINANVVYEGDFFQYEEGSSAYVKFRRALRPASQLQEIYKAGGDPNHLGVAWFCAAWMRGARHPQVTVLDPLMVEQTRRRSKAGEKGPWVTDYDSMGTKTSIRRAAKLWQLSPNLSRALALEDRQEGIAEGGGAADAADLFSEVEEAMDSTAIEVAGGTVSQQEQKKGTLDSLAEKLAAGKKKEREPGEDG